MQELWRRHSVGGMWLIPARAQELRRPPPTRLHERAAVRLLPSWQVQGRAHRQWHALERRLPRMPRRTDRRVLPYLHVLRRAVCALHPDPRRPAGGARAGLRRPAVHDWDQPQQGVVQPVLQVRVQCAMRLHTCVRQQRAGLLRDYGDCRHAGHLQAGALQDHVIQASSHRWLRVYHLPRWHHWHWHHHWHRPCTVQCASRVPSRRWWWWWWWWWW